MDILAHALWTFVLFPEKEWVWTAILLGFLADTLVFGPIMIAALLQGQRNGPPRITGTFMKQWAKLYNVTHSLVIWTIVSATIYFIIGEFWYPLLGWLIHIVVDIPTHEKAYFPTPFLWPLSNYTVDGIPWSKPLFMKINYGLLAVVGLAYLLATL